MEIKHSELFTLLDNNDMVSNIEKIRVRALSKNGMPFFSISLPYTCKSEDPSYRDNFIHLGTVFMPEIKTDDITYKSRLKEANKLDHDEYSKSEHLFGMLLNTDTKIATVIDPLAMQIFERLLTSSRIKPIAFKQLKSKISDSLIDLDTVDEKTKDVIDKISKAYSSNDLNLGSSLNFILGKAPHFIAKNEDGFLTNDGNFDQNISNAKIMNHSETIKYSNIHGSDNLFDIVKYTKDPDYKNKAQNTEIKKQSIKP